MSKIAAFQASLAGLALVLASGCAARYTIKSYPEGATVFVKDVLTQEKKLVGQTPLKVKKTKEMGDVFFLSLEKDNFYPKQVLVTPHEGNNLMISVNLDPIQDNNRTLASKGKEDGKNQQPNPQDQQKKQDDAMKDLNLRVALLENTIAMYKDALFSGRYGGGMASYDRDRTDEIVDHLFKSQQLVMVKKYAQAQDELDKALMMDEYLPQAYLIKGTIFYVNKQYDQAKIAWERCLKIDPYNAQAYEYLRLVDNKLGQPLPPDRPSMLRVPASDAFARSLNH